MAGEAEPQAYKVTGIPTMFLIDKTGTLRFIDARESTEDKVKKLIEEEDPARPLTDEQITRILQSQGIQVTRRTVAKYREEGHDINDNGVYKNPEKIIVPFSKASGREGEIRIANATSISVKPRVDLLFGFLFVIAPFEITIFAIDISQSGKRIY